MGEGLASHKRNVLGPGRGLYRIVLCNLVKQYCLVFFIFCSLVGFFWIEVDATRGGLCGALFLCKWDFIVISDYDECKTLWNTNTVLPIYIYYQYFSFKFQKSQLIGLSFAFCLKFLQ